MRIYYALLTVLAASGSGGVPVTQASPVAIETVTAGNQLAPGAAFFYVVRFQDGTLTGPWGFGSESGERAGTGGCTSTDPFAGSGRDPRREPG